MTSALYEVRTAARGLVRSPAYTALIVATLAIGFGFNSAMFAVVRSVLLEPLPWMEPERLVLLWNHAEGRDEMGLSQPELVDYREARSSIEQLGAYRSGGANLEVDARQVGWWVTRVSRHLLSTLGARPHLGRLFLDAEYDVGDHRVALLSFELWRRAFGGSPDATSRTIRVDGEPYRVATIETLDDGQGDEEALDGLRKRVLATIARAADGPKSLVLEGELPHDLLVNALSQSLGLRPVEKQSLLDCDTLEARYGRLIEILEFHILEGTAGSGSASVH